MRQQQLNIALAIRANVDVETVRTVIAAFATITRAEVAAAGRVALGGVAEFHRAGRAGGNGRNPRDQSPVTYAGRVVAKCEFKKKFRNSIDV